MARMAHEAVDRTFFENIRVADHPAPPGHRAVQHHLTLMARCHDQQLGLSTAQIQVARRKGDKFFRLIASRNTDLPRWFFAPVEWGIAMNV